MDKKKELKEIEALKKAKLRPYTLDTFKKYWTFEEDYECKKARVVNATYIVVYSLWHKRLLARIFYLEEYMKYKKITRKLFEVQRQVSGMSIKISQRLYNGTGIGVKVWTGISYNGWSTGSATSWQLFRIYNAWTYENVINFEEYNNSIPYLLKSEHKYSAYELVPEDKKEHNYMFEYLLKYEKHPQIEMLTKMGLPDIIDNLTGIRWTKKGVAMLGVNKQELQYLKTGMSLIDYRKIRGWCLKYKFTVAEAKTALNIYKMIASSRMSINLEFSPRLVRYITNNDISLIDYQDLIRAKKELGLPDENKYLYPNDFKKMHDELNKKIKIKKSEELTRKIKEREKELRKFEIKKNGLMIKALLSQNELIEEGEKMHHCVGMYADKVAQGNTAIYSIRRTEEPDNPLATLELKGKKVIQVRAEHNRVPPIEVQEFVKKWEKKYQLAGY